MQHLLHFYIDSAKHSLHMHAFFPQVCDPTAKGLIFSLLALFYKLPAGMIITNIYWRGCVRPLECHGCFSNLIVVFFHPLTETHDLYNQQR